MNKEKNLEVAKRGLALPETFNLDMENYCLSQDSMPKPAECDTAFCFAGYLAAEDGYPSKYRIMGGNAFKYYTYSKELLGIEDKGKYNQAWGFFFSENWPSTFKDLKERCQYVIDNGGKIPEKFNAFDNTWIGKE